jgi:sarcosine oxidase subunit delta
LVWIQRSWFSAVLLIDCPHCGPRAQEEFVYERTSDAVVRFEDTPEAAIATLYARDNPRGASEEIWWHAYGCRGWMLIRRDRVSHAIAWVRALGPEPLA